MNIDLDQLKELVKHSRRIGTEDKCLDLAVEYAEALCKMLSRRTALLKEAYGWLGPHDHNPVELGKRIEDELEKTS